MHLLMELMIGTEEGNNNGTSLTLLVGDYLHTAFLPTIPLRSNCIQVHLESEVTTKGAHSFSYQVLQANNNNKMSEN